VHWARLEASALGSLIAACPAWKKEEEEEDSIHRKTVFAMQASV